MCFLLHLNALLFKIIYGLFFIMYYSQTYQERSGALFMVHLEAIFFARKIQSLPERAQLFDLI